MLYQRPSFTLPASHDTSQKQWDRAFLTVEEFKAKYSEDRDSEPHDD